MAESTDSVNSVVASFQQNINFDQEKIVATVAGDGVDGGLKSGPAYSVTTRKVALRLDKYSCTQRRRGRCIIINQHHFNKKLTGQNDRHGTEVDAIEAQNVFEHLAFQVTRFDDLTVEDLLAVGRDVSREDHSDADCFVCVILSHGDDDGIIYGTNGSVQLFRIVDMFKGNQCPSLAGKPKLFFIQACRGAKYDHGVLVEDQVDAPSTDIVVPAVRRIPVEADVLIAYSVVPGYYAWRNMDKGSWFMQALVRVLHEYGTSMDVLQMLTLVNKVVAFDFDSDTDSEFTSGMKQVPCVISTLTKLCYFEPK